MMYDDFPITQLWSSKATLNKQRVIPIYIYILCVFPLVRGLSLSDVREVRCQWRMWAHPCSQYGRTGAYHVAVGIARWCNTVERSYNFLQPTEPKSGSQSCIYVFLDAQKSDASIRHPQGWRPRWLLPWTRFFYWFILSKNHIKPPFIEEKPHKTCIYRGFFPYFSLF